MHGIDSSEIVDWIAETDQGLLRGVKQLIIVVEPTGFGDLQSIVEAKAGDGLRFEAEKLAKVVREGLPNASVKVQPPNKMVLEVLYADAARVGIVNTDRIWEGWMEELRRAISGL